MTLVTALSHLCGLDEDKLYNNHCHLYSSTTLLVVVCVQYNLRISTPSLSQLEVTYIKTQ